MWQLDFRKFQFHTGKESCNFIYDSLHRIFAASTGFIIASLIPFHTEAAVLLIPLKNRSNRAFHAIEYGTNLTFMPSTTEEITDLIPFHTDDATDFTALNIVDTVVLMAFKTDDTLLLIAFHTVEITFLSHPLQMRLYWKLHGLQMTLQI